MIKLETRKETYNNWMALQWRMERIKRNDRLSYRCKLAAILAADNRTGKNWK